MNDKRIVLSKYLGEVFMKERMKQQISRNSMSELAGIARTNVRMVETGKRSPTIQTCSAVADVLGLPLSTLIRRAEKAYKESQGG